MCGLSEEKGKKGYEWKMNQEKKVEEQEEM